MKIKLILLLMLGIVFNITAQDYLFKVLATKGDVTIYKDGGKTPIRPLLGSKINRGDIIVLKGNSYLGLAHISNKTIELKNEGTYPTDKLAEEVKSQNASTYSKYLKFIIESASKSQPENMSSNRYKYMSVVGSVERSTTQELNVLLPQENPNKFLTDSIYLKWANEEDITRIDITNLFGDVLASKITQDSSIYLKLPISERNFIITLESNNKVKSFNLIRPTLTDLVSIKNEYTLLKNELKTESALNYLILASFFEEYGFYLEAMNCYERSLKLETNEGYQKVYQEFLLRRF